MQCFGRLRVRGLACVPRSRYRPRHIVCLSVPDRSKNRSRRCCALLALRLRGDRRRRYRLCCLSGRHRRLYHISSGTCRCGCGHGRGSRGGCGYRCGLRYGRRCRGIAYGYLLYLCALSHKTCLLLSEAAAANVGVLVVYRSAVRAFPLVELRFSVLLLRRCGLILLSVPVEPVFLLGGTSARFTNYALECAC